MKNLTHLHLTDLHTFILRHIDEDVNLSPESRYRMYEVMDTLDELRDEKFREEYESP